MPDARTTAWRQLADDQEGAVTRRQLLRCGLSESAAAWLVADRGWPQVHRGVYVTFTGPMPWPTRVWAAVLCCGTGAVVAGRSALQLHGVLDEAPGAIHIAVPVHRHPGPRPGLVITRRRNLGSLAQQAGSPPRLRVEEATLDVAAHAARTDEAVAVTLAAVQRRRTTPERLASALTARARYPRRALLEEVLADAAGGVHSMLEQRYLVNVERAHGLPRAERNLRDVECDASGRPVVKRYRDVTYREQRLVIELDGRQHDTAGSRADDTHRDNLLLLRGVVTMRYSWREVADRPCTVAAEVATMLERRGWSGSARRCGERCAVIVTDSTVIHG